MPVLRIVLMALFGAAAVLAGLLIAAVVAMVGGIARLLGGGRPRRHPNRRGAVPHNASGDVIDVTATEVRDEERLRH